MAPKTTVSITEAVEMFPGKFTRGQLLRAVQKKKLPATRIGWSWFVRPDDVRTWWNAVQHGR